MQCYCAFVPPQPPVRIAPCSSRIASVRSSSRRSIRTSRKAATATENPLCIIVATSSSKITRLLYRLKKKEGGVFPLPYPLF